VQTTYGWIECAGLADRSAFDLTAHTKASKVELVAWENYDEPRMVDFVEVVPNMKILGKELKADGKAVADHLLGLPEADALSLKVHKLVTRLPEPCDRCRPHSSGSTRDQLNCKPPRAHATGGLLPTSVAPPSRECW
jgi:glycyl-tRNA synthetase (class II)